MIEKDKKQILTTVNNPVFNAPAQFGNNNTQYNNVDKKLAPEYLEQMLSYIKKLQVDSNFHSKKVSVESTNGSNMTVYRQVIEYLKSNGYDVGTGWVLFSQELPQMSIRIRRKEDCIEVAIGEFR